MTITCSEYGRFGRCLVWALANTVHEPAALAAGARISIANPRVRDS